MIPGLGRINHMAILLQPSKAGLINIVQVLHDAHSILFGQFAFEDLGSHTAQGCNTIYIFLLDLEL